MSFQDEIFIFSICLLSIAAPVLAVVGYWLLQRRSMRGFQDAIAMDGAVCLRADDGRVVIRRRTARTIALLFVIGSVLLGMLFLFISSLISTVSGDSTFGQSSSGLVLPVIIISILSPAIAVAVSSLRKPSVCFNPYSRMIEIGKGTSMRRVPFSSISRIRSKLSKRRTWRTGYGGSVSTAVYTLAVILRDDEQIQLGTVSGDPSKTKKRAADIDGMIRKALRASRTYE